MLVDMIWKCSGPPGQEHSHISALGLAGVVDIEGFDQAAVFRVENAGE
jgi:hypothetical protein